MNGLTSTSWPWRKYEKKIQAMAVCKFEKFSEWTSEPIVRLMFTLMRFIVQPYKQRFGLIVLFRAYSCDERILSGKRLAFFLAHPEKKWKKLYFYCLFQVKNKHHVVRCIINIIRLAGNLRYFQWFFLFFSESDCCFPCTSGRRKRKK